MNETTLPPSPNWYLSNILTCSSNGTIAWGARNAIVIAKFNENEKTLQYSIIKHAHKTKVTCLAFTPQFKEVNTNLLVSAGDDNVIKVWNLETLSISCTYTLKSDVQAIAVDWSHKDPYVVYSTTSDGCVLSWNSYFDTFSLILLGKITPTSLSSCPHDPHLVAVGSKSGLVYIVNFQGKGRVVYKLRGHDTEVVSLAWCPLENNVISGNSNRDLLLASGGKDRSIFIWRAGGDGRYEMMFLLPSTPLDSHYHKSKSVSAGGNWTVIHWIEPKLLLTNSNWGELLSWDLSIISKQKPISKLIHSRHSTGLFSIAHVPITQESTVENWRTRDRLTIWTSAQDRRVVCCNINENNVEIVHDIFTQGGYVYCIAACPLDTSRIAFGVGDTMLRLWNLSEAHSTTFDITVFWQKIKGKIRAISWHPEKENLLAYATEEGRIGMFNTNSNKLPTLYRQYHRNVVYTIHWGPGPDNKYVLYSCAEGELVYYDAEKPNQEPKSILKKECTEFAWKPDLSCLAVGFENGSISFFNRKFKIFGTAEFSSKMLYCIVWHPESTTTDLTFSPLKNYIAVAYESNTIVIFDLSNLMDHFTKLQDSASNGEENSDIYKVHEVVATLTGHIENVVCLAWSPYISGHLVSGSYDGTAQVWNVETQELIATYTGHSGPVLCCMWSPLNSDFIITSSADFTVRIWKVASNLPQEPVPKKALKKSKKKQDKANNVTDASAQNNVINLTDTLSECTISDNFQTVQKSKTAVLKEVKRKKSERTAYFSNTASSTNNKSIVLDSLLKVVKNIKSEENVNIEENQNDSPYYMIPLLFSKQENLVSFLTSEKRAHIEKNRYDLTTEMDMWSDNLKQNLDEAAKEKRLNDFLVSLSASLSMKTWKEMCELYAYQLITEGNPYKAVSYLLCIHKTYKAIEVFQDANLHKEAYVLARCKLEPDDPVLENVLRNWAKYSVNVGHFEEAAFIFAKLGDFSDIVKYLVRRKDAATLITAAEIALLYNDDNLSKSVAKQAVTTALENLEYDVARNIITKFPYLKCQEICLLTLQELQKIIKRNVNLDMVQTWLNGKSDYGLLQTLETICGDCSCYYSDLCQNRFLNTLKNEKMLWLTVSHELALAVASAEKEQKLKHIVTALHTIVQFETLNRKNLENQCSFLIEIVIKLDAKNLTDEESIYAKTIYPVSTSLRAYLCYAVLNWLVCDIDRNILNSSAQTCVDLIENLLEDALNKQTVKQWSITSEINKLENQITSVACKESDEDKNDQQTKSLIEELNALKVQKKQVSEELIYMPNPVMTYSKANELSSKLSDETVKVRFLDILSKLWTNATS